MMMTVLQQRDIHNNKVNPPGDESIAQVEAGNYSSIEEAQKAIKETLYKDMKVDSYGYSGDDNQYVGTVSYHQHNQLYLTLYYFVKERKHFKLYVGHHDVKVTEDIKKWRDHAGSYIFDCIAGPYDQVIKYEKTYHSLQSLKSFEQNLTLLVKDVKKDEEQL